MVDSSDSDMDSDSVRVGSVEESFINEEGKEKIELCSCVVIFFVDFYMLINHLLKKKQIGGLVY